MEKYGSLKGIAHALIIVAWLFLVGSIILSYYLVENGTASFLGIIYYLIYGVVGCLLLLGVGKSILLLIDIRDAQFTEKIKDSDNSVDFSEKDTKEPTSPAFTTVNVDITKEYLSELKGLINKQKKVLFGDGKPELIHSCIEKAVISQKTALRLIDMYNIEFEKNLLDELKGLTTNYNTIKNYMVKFIEFGIVESEYPHSNKHPE